jgi:hypothetical protein
MNIKTLTVFCVSLFIISGCATRASGIAPASVSALEYQALTCEETRGMLTAKRSALVAAEKSQNNAATLDTISTVVLLVPAASIFGGDSEGKVAQLKGEVLALERALPQNCRVEEAE